MVKRLRHRPFTAETWVRFPSGSPIKYAAVAQLVEQLTCRMNILFRIILHLYVETHKVDTANSGKAKFYNMLIPS